MTRIFRTETPTPTDELKQNIGKTICQIITPWVFEIVSMEHDSGLRYTITCRVTGKVTDIGHKFIEECEKNE